MKTLPVLILCSLSWTLLFSQNFTEVAASININTTYGGGSFGGGISFADFNEDGWDDLTFASEDGQPIYFFTNIQGTYVPTSFGIDVTEETKQVIWVDFDNDGDKDFYCAVLNGYNRLYQNNGNGSFSDISISSGIRGEINADSFGACFGDSNNDGWLDLYVVNRSFSLGEPTNHLYLNNGNGTFTDVGSGISGIGGANIGPVNNGIKPTFQPVFFDADQNGWPDIFLAQDRLTYPNDLLLNFNGSYTNASVASGVDHYIDGMNAGVADYDNDLDLDVYVTNTPGGNLLLQNDGSGVFTNVAGSAGVVANHVGWGANFIDSENDGDLDLYVSSSTQNGIESNRFYTNDGNGVFSENLPGGGLPGDLMSSYANAIGDYNNDGHMDIAVSNSVANHFIWKNNNNNNNNTSNWLKIDLVGTVSNREGIGSWIEIYAGGDTFLRYKKCGESYLAQNSDYIHVGIADHTVIDEVKVIWPSGNITSIFNEPSNQTLKIIETGTPLALNILDFSLKSIEDNAFNLSWDLEGNLRSHQVVLQKSITGLDFEDVLLSNNKNTYRDWEVQPNLQYYYRLKISDQTGKVQYSKIINASLNVRSSLSNVSIFPNPADKNLNLQITSTAKDVIHYKIVDSSGRTIHSFDFDVEIGNNDFQINIESLSPNHYFLQIEFNGEVVLRPFSKR